MKTALIHVPYHLGREGAGMGVGPTALLSAGLAGALEDAGHDTEVLPARLEHEEANEIAASFAVLRVVAERTREAVERGCFPLALAGNCMTSVGVVAGIGEDVGVVWLDAHPDFDSAEGTETGFADGMGLSILTGTGWDALRATIPGYRAVADDDVVLVGARDVAPGERRRLAAARIHVLAADAAEDELEPVLATLERSVEGVYLHLDLDVLDPSEGLANEYAAPGGLTVAAVERVISRVGATLRIRGASVTAYDPALDVDGRVANAATRLATRIVEAAAVADPVSAR